MVKRKNWWLSLLGLLLGILIVTPVKAAIDNITIVPQTNGTQTDRFQMITKPGEQRQLKVIITNFANTPQTVIMVPRNATMSTQGKILFNVSGKISAAPDFRQMARRQQLTIAARKTKTVTVPLKVARQAFKGLLIGGLHFYTADEDTGAVDVPVWLTETNRSVTPKLALNGVTAKTYGGQPYLIVNLENRRGALLKNVTVDLKITHYGFLGLGNSTTTYVQTYKNFAPYSLLPITWGRANTPVKSGRYAITGTVTSQGQQWYLKQRAVLSHAAAKKANAQATNLTPDYTWLLLLVVAVLVVLNGAIIAVIIRRHRQR